MAHYGAGGAAAGCTAAGCTAAGGAAAGGAAACVRWVVMVPVLRVLVYLRARLTQSDR